MKYIALALLVGGTATVARYANKGLETLPLALIGMIAAIAGGVVLVGLWFAGL